MHYILATNTRKAGIKNPKKVSCKTNSSFRISWLLVGILLGTAVTSFAMFKLKDTNLKFSLPKPQNKTKLQVKPNIQSQAKAKPSKPKFEFYNELTKEAEQPTLKLALKKPNKPQATYTIQTGSFSKKTDAEQFKAELALKGFNATVNMVELKTGQKWYRVSVGSLKSAQEIAVQKQLLSEHNIDSNLVTEITR